MLHNSDESYMAVYILLCILAFFISFIFLVLKITGAVAFSWLFVASPILILVCIMTAFIVIAYSVFSIKVVIDNKKKRITKNLYD